MNEITSIINSTKDFYNDLKRDPNARYRSWEYCYKMFHDARKKNNPDIDYLSLQLAFYLASWGMYRGSSFLLQKDYKVHAPVVKEILKEKYDPLFGIDCCEYRNVTNQELLEKVCEALVSYYEKIRDNVKGKDINFNISDTLITKILMGTLGCVPAYDRYFINGVRNKKVTTGIFNIKSILKLADFYESNNEALEKLRDEMKVSDLPYPQMKVLDMGFWQIGFENDKASLAK